MGVESEVLVENVGHFHSSSKYSPQYTRGSEMYLTMTARVVWRVIYIPLSTELLTKEQTINRN